MNFSVHIQLSCWAVVISMCIAGCTRLPGDSNTDAAQSAVNTANITGEKSDAVRPAGNTATNHAAKKTISLDWDLGLIAPASKHRQSFIIRNESDRLWTLDKIGTSCSCTVADLKFESIAPGTHESLGLQFTAGNGASDTQKSVLVHFRESFAPLVVVNITASPRPEITIAPKAVFMKWHKGTSETQTAHATIQKFSSRDVGQPKINTDVSWLDASFGSIEPTALRQTVVAKEAFQVSFAVSPETLSVGSHRATVTFVMAEESVAIPVSVIVDPPIRAIPRQMFFGELAPGESKTQSIDIVVAQEFRHLECRVVHDWGNDAQFEIQKMRHGARLTATIHAPFAKHLGPQQVDVIWGAGELKGTDARIEIPIVVKCNERREL